MQLAFDAAVEAFRAEFLAFLDEHLPDEAETVPRSRSPSDVPAWSCHWFPGTVLPDPEAALSRAARGETTCVAVQRDRQFARLRSENSSCGKNKSLEALKGLRPGV